MSVSLTLDLLLVDRVEEVLYRERLLLEDLIVLDLVFLRPKWMNALIK